MSGKARPERVKPEMALRAYQESTASERRPDRARQNGWSAYIVAHFRATGNLAPGCDARDFFAWWDGYRAEGEGQT